MPRSNPEDSRTEAQTVIHQKLFRWATLSENLKKLACNILCRLILQPAPNHKASWTTVDDRKITPTIKVRHVNSQPAPAFLHLQISALPMNRRGIYRAASNKIFNQASHEIMRYLRVPSSNQVQGSIDSKIMLLLYLPKESCFIHPNHRHSLDPCRKPEHFFRTRVNPSALFFDDCTHTTETFKLNSLHVSAMTFSRRRTNISCILLS